MILSGLRSDLIEEVFDKIFWYESLVEGEVLYFGAAWYNQ